MSELEPAADRENAPAASGTAPEEAVEDEAESALAPMPMPGEGRLAVAAMWIFATALLGCFLIAAIVLVFDLAAFDLASGEDPADHIPQDLLYTALFGSLTALHVVAAVQLRRGRNWSRYVVKVLEAGAIATSLYVVAMPFRDSGVPFQVAGIGLLGILLFSCVLAFVSTQAMRAWCTAGKPERPDPAGPGRSRMLR